MRTFPKSLAAFREIVEERGKQLRALSQEELKQLASKPPEHITVESRQATVGIIVQQRPDGALLVVIQGFMKAHFVPGKHVALDGFCKHSDGTTSEMPDEEFYKFDWGGLGTATYFSGLPVTHLFSACDELDSRQCSKLSRPVAPRAMPQEALGTGSVRRELLSC